MSRKKDVDYGPLTDLIGVWKGEDGTDVAPGPDAPEISPYCDTITFTPAGGVTNAKKQKLVAIHYHQIVQRKSNGNVFHNETGYWMWEPATQVIMHSLVIPRAVCVLAGGTYTGAKDAEGRVVIEVSAACDDDQWKIVESPFMRDNASTKSFRQKIAVGNGKLSFSETTMVDIYGELFEHTDEDQLVRAD